MRHGLAPLKLCLASLIAAAGAVAQPLAPERLPAAEAGLTGSFVLAVAVDAAGFLWIGSSSGVDRWDGVRLVSHAPPEGVRVLAAGAGGTWTAGDGVAYHDGARWRVLRDRRPGSPLGEPVRAVWPDGRGGAWAGLEAHGLVHAVPARGRYGRVRGLPSDSVRALVRPRQALAWLWVGTPAGVSRVHLATGRVVTRRPGGDATAVVACADAGAAVWCATRGGRLHALDPATGRTRRTVAVGAEPSAVVASRARPGWLWVGTRGHGLWALDPAGAVGPASRGPAAEALARADVMGLAEGADGVLWVGTLVGLFRADARAPALAPGAAVPDAPPVLALHEPASAPGTLWLGTMRGGLHRLDRATGRLTSWPAAPGVPPVVFAVHEDRRGQLWLGGLGAALARFDAATGRAERVVLDTRPGAVVYHVDEDAARPGRLWVATQAAGLVEFDADRRRVVRQWAPGAPGRFRLDSAAVVWASVAPPGTPGVRWLATDGAGLVRLDVASGRLRPAPTAPGCTLGTGVFSVAPAPDGTLWLGVKRRGLVHYTPQTGACRAVPPDNGQPADGYAVTLDRRGRVWMATRTRGVVVLDPANGAQTRFTTADGLPSDESFVPAHGRTVAGEWLVGGPGGWTALALERLARGARPPRVVVTGLRVDGRPVPAHRALALPHHRNDVAVEFAALDLQQPAANRYRVRLDRAGLDAQDETRAWTPLGTRADVRFPFLAPGRYTLRVAGAGGSGRWAEAPPVALTVHPPLWRRWWAQLLAAVLAVGLVAGAYQVRIRQILRLEATRRRIADDLHDDIGSKVSTVALRLDLAGQSAALPPDEKARLADLAATARGVVTDLRDAVWFVDSGHDDLAALVDRIEQAAGQMLVGRPHAVRRPATLPAVTLPMERRRHLFLWVREALHNASKHGDGAVTVHVAVEAGWLAVAVEDEGPGFCPDGARRGRGLTTLAARAEALGGQCTVESAPGRATRVSLNVPLR